MTARCCAGAFFFTRSDNWVYTLSLPAQIARWFWAWLPSAVSVLAFCIILFRAEIGSADHSSVNTRFDRAFPYWAALLFLVVAATRLSFFHLNLATDERAYRFQADLVRQGCLRTSAPPYADSFPAAASIAKTSGPVPISPAGRLSSLCLKCSTSTL